MKYAHKRHCYIVKDLEGYPRKKVLLDCGGNVLFSFPLDIEDSTIWLALDFANLAYRRGFDVGKHSAQRKIQAAIGIKD